MHVHLWIQYPYFQLLNYSFCFRLLVGSSSWYQGAVEKYTKGTGSYNKYRRGARDGTLIINNITYAEAGKYECVVNSAVGTIYAHSEGIQCCFFLAF